MILSNGSNRARHISSIVNNTNVCGGEKKRGVPAMSTLYPGVPKSVGCRRANCMMDTICAASKTRQVKHNTGVSKHLN